LESYKANFCIFFHDKHNYNIHSENNSSENQNISKKILNAVYVALKGDLFSSPGFDTNVNISMMGSSYIVISITSNDPSKLRASALSILRLIDLVYRTVFNVC